MSGFQNRKKDKFLEEFPRASLDSDADVITAKCKFNFSYFIKQPAGQAFDEWSHPQLIKLFEKLREYSKESLTYWRGRTIGKSGVVLSIYGAFPKKSDFSLPSHIPYQAEWGRFRLESAVRLVGFVIPHEYDNRYHPVTGMKFDCNTFYVVFLDANHAFYKTEKK
jgi:hypothetical protein